MTTSLDYLFERINDICDEFMDVQDLVSGSAKKDVHDLLIQTLLIRDQCDMDGLTREDIMDRAIPNIMRMYKILMTDFYQVMSVYSDNSDVSEHLRRIEYALSTFPSMIGRVFDEYSEKIE